MPNPAEQFFINLAKDTAQKTGKGRVVLREGGHLFHCDLQRWNEEYTQSDILAFIDCTGEQLIPAFNTDGVLQ